MSPRKKLSKRRRAKKVLRRRSRPAKAVAPRRRIRSERRPVAPAPLIEVVERALPAAAAEPSHRLPALPFAAAFAQASAAGLVPRAAQEVEAYKSALKSHLQVWPEVSLLGGAKAFRAGPAPRSGILGVGFGAKLSGGQVVQAECVRVYVPRKLPEGSLGAGVPLIPSTIDGLPTDVIEAPAIQAQAQGGDSVGHYATIAGTLGCLVTRAGRRFILSNNHVLAECNAGQVGDDIYHPGPYDGGVPPPLARLSEFVPLDFSGGPNAVDAALAQVVQPGSVAPTVRLIGPIGAANATPVAGLLVKKCGRTTNLTSGYVEGLSEDVPVNYPGAGTAYFEGQIAIRGANVPFSRGGDSGSLVLTAEGNQPVALLFAGDESKALTFASGIAGVFGQLGVTIVR
jgi:hypothetical protein